MLTKGPLKAPVVIYLISRYSMILRSQPITDIACRVSTLGFLITGFFLSPAGIDINCHIGAIATECFFFLALTSNLALFCLRARAVYQGNQLVRGTLLALWLATVGSCLTVFFVFDAVPNPRKEVSSCILTERSFSASIAIALTAFVHDTAVFVSISYRMYQLIHLDKYSEDKLFQLLIPAPSNILSLWRCILQDGQIFYLYVFFFRVI